MESRVCQEPYQRWCVGRAVDGGPAMPRTEYFRRQSDICLRLSLIASDDEVASRLIVMAQEYKAKADELAAESKPRMAVIISSGRRRRYKQALARLCDEVAN